MEDELFLEDEEEATMLRVQLMADILADVKEDMTLSEVLQLDWVRKRCHEIRWTPTPSNIISLKEDMQAMERAAKLNICMMSAYDQWEEVVFKFSQTTAKRASDSAQRTIKEPPAEQAEEEPRNLEDFEAEPGEEVTYTSRVTGEQFTAKVLAKHPPSQDDPTPFYTIQLEGDATERNTVASTLSPPPSRASSFNNRKSGARTVDLPNSSAGDGSFAPSCLRRTQGVSTSAAEPRAGSLYICDDSWPMSARSITNAPMRRPPSAAAGASASTASSKAVLPAARGFDARLVTREASLDSSSQSEDGPDVISSRPMCDRPQRGRLSAPPTPVSTGHREASRYGTVREDLGMSLADIDLSDLPDGLPDATAADVGNGASAHASASKFRCRPREFRYSNESVLTSVASVDGSLRIGSNSVEHAVLRSLGGARAGRHEPGTSSGHGPGVRVGAGTGMGAGAVLREGPSPPTMSPPTMSPLLLRAAREARNQRESLAQLTRSPPALVSESQMESPNSQRSSQSGSRPGSVSSSRASSFRSRASSFRGGGSTEAIEMRRMRLQELADLKEAGLITSDVFAAKQREILMEL